MSKILVCVDCQYDFIEGGNLPVTGGKKAMRFLTRYVSRHIWEYDAIIFTLDWHPVNHCSFVTLGGQWPVHCVQHTYGAALFQPLFDVIPTDRLVIFEKGTSPDCDEYSFLGNDVNRKKFNQLLDRLQPQQIDVCGIAGDVCVKNTIQDIINLYSSLCVCVIMPAIVSIDNEVTSEFIKKNHIKVIKR